MTNQPGDADQPSADAPTTGGHDEQPTQPNQGYPPVGYGTPGPAGPPQHGGYPAPGPPAGYAGYPPYVVAPPTHGGGLAAMIVGIVSLVLCFGYGIGLLGSPVAWWLGRKAMREIDAQPGRYSGRGMAQAGFILGIIGTILLGLLILALIVFLVIMLAVGFGEGASGPPVEPF